MAEFRIGEFESRQNRRPGGNVLELRDLDGSFFHPPRPSQGLHQAEPGDCAQRQGLTDPLPELHGEIVSMRSLMDLGFQQESGHLGNIWRRSQLLQSLVRMPLLIE